MTRNNTFRLWVFIFLVFLGVLALALWLDLRHQTPSFTIVDFTVPTSKNGQDHPDIYVALDVKNPNPVYSINYEYSEFTMYYHQGILGMTKILINPGFHQAKNKANQMSDQVEADDHQWAALLKALAKPPGQVTLQVELKTGIRFHNLGHNSKLYDLKFQGQFNIGSDGKIIGKKKVKLCSGSC